MVIGTAVGYFGKSHLDAALLKQLFGGLILWFSSRELWFLKTKKISKIKPAWVTKVITFFAGITHGLFASGGPLLVYALAGTTLDKTSFRATLVFVWFMLNLMLTITFLIDGSLLPVISKTLYFIPVINSRF